MRSAPTRRCPDRGSGVTRDRCASVRQLPGRNGAPPTGPVSEETRESDLSPTPCGSCGGYEEFRSDFKFCTTGKEEVPKLRLRSFTFLSSLLTVVFARDLLSSPVESSRL